MLAELRQALTIGIVTEDDIRSLLTQPVPAQTAGVAKDQDKPEKLSAVDVMFYIAGIILFSAIMSMIAQSWEEGNAFVHILLSAGIGAGLWSLAYYLIKNPLQNDVRKGLINSLLLTGSLCITVGGYIIANQIVGGFGEINFIPGAVMLAVVGGMHLWFDRLVKKDLILLMGTFLGVAAFPALIFGILQGANLSPDVWALVLMISAGLLAFATRVVAKFNPDRPKMHNSFDGFAAFVALMSMYVVSFGDYGVVWLAVLACSVFGIFYLSIIAQNKHLLGNGSFFLVLVVITIAFKYFSGFGITVSLVVATMGLLGSAAIASGINKKYFKQPKPTN